MKFASDSLQFSYVELTLFKKKSVNEHEQEFIFLIKVKI
ncbi:hypothetical protein LEP1GSC035_2606 [Leptospira noguchii str. 2007001578]|uniref:Uncharacterized protein n=1 Tax=Leptospira noguchii str. 2007001578 TaxID=1049974 RepID=A0ABN0J4D9_9LEPT|nr:hypothetical protein LEP1GSC035_2606 [Leptospira noguchii str. 2007001578]